MAIGRQAVAGALPRMHQAVTRLIPGRTLLVAATIDVADPIHRIIIDGLRRSWIARVTHGCQMIDRVTTTINVLHTIIQLRQAAVRSSITLYDRWLPKRQAYSCSLTGWYRKI